MTLVYIGMVMLRSCNWVGIWRVPSRKSSAASIAITVQVLLPLGLPPMEDWQMYGGSCHSVTSRCRAIVIFMWRVVWESGVGNEADWLLQVLWVLSCWFAVCYEQWQFEQLMSPLTVHVSFSQEEHLTCTLLSLLCPRPGWWHCLQWGGALLGEGVVWL